MLVILCSGQGGQSSCMFDTLEKVPEVQHLFSALTRYLGKDPVSYVKTARQDLFQNETAQLLCVGRALAVWAGIQRRIPSEYVVAGYSVGAVAAWAVAGIASPEAALSLAQKRGQLMSRASQKDDGMAFIRGMNTRAVATLASRFDAQIAIVNPADLVIVGGSRPNLQLLCHAALNQGATAADMIDVHVASHTQRLSAVVPQFETVLREVSLTAPRPGVILLGSVHAAPVFSVEAARCALAEEIHTELQWDSCLRAAYERGGRVFLELGPGQALANMVRNEFPDVAARSFDDFHTLDGMGDWLSKSMASYS